MRRTEKMDINTNPNIGQSEPQLQTIPLRHPEENTCSEEEPSPAIRKRRKSCPLPSKKSRGKKKAKAEDDASEDEAALTSALTSNTARLKKWAVDFLNDHTFFGKDVSVKLDASKFVAPELPVRVRMLDPNRVDQILKSFNKLNMLPGKILFMDTDEDGNVLPGLQWHTLNSDTFANFFNKKSVMEITNTLGSPVVIGGYHSSQALVKKASEANSTIDPLRPCFVYRLSQVLDPEQKSETSRMSRMKLARYLSTCDNSCSQETEGYDAQSPLLLAYLWKELYDQQGRPHMRQVGKHQQEFVDFRNQCVGGVERLENLLKHSNSTTALTPLLKVVTLPSTPDQPEMDMFRKMFTILCCFDDRREAAGMPLERLAYVDTQPPLTESEVQAGKKWKGRSMKFEDLKEICRMPYDDRIQFINLVHDDLYVLDTLGYDDERALSTTVSVWHCLFCILIFILHFVSYYYLRLLFLIIRRNSFKASSLPCSGISGVSLPAFMCTC